MASSDLYEVLQVVWWVVRARCRPQFERASKGIGSKLEHHPRRANFGASTSGYFGNGQQWISLISFKNDYIIKSGFMLCYNYYYVFPHKSRNFPSDLLPVPFEIRSNCGRWLSLQLSAYTHWKRISIPVVYEYFAFIPYISGVFSLNNWFSWNLRQTWFTYLLRMID